MKRIISLFLAALILLGTIASSIMMAGPLFCGPVGLDSVPAV